MNRAGHAPTRRKQARLYGPRPGYFDMPAKSKTCGKRRCASYEQALAYALWLARKTCTPLRIYPCPTCGGFHLTKRKTWEDPT